LNCLFQSPKTGNLRAVQDSDRLSHTCAQAKIQLWISRAAKAGLLQEGERKYINITPAAGQGPFLRGSNFEAYIYEAVAPRRQSLRNQAQGLKPPATVALSLAR